MLTINVFFYQSNISIHYLFCFIRDKKVGHSCSHVTMREAFIFPLLIYLWEEIVLLSLNFLNLFLHWPTDFLQTFNTAGVDYVGISKNLDFSPGVNMQTFKVTILDDLGQPVLEGPEKFELVLRMPMNGILGEPGKATIYINDSISDCERSYTKP